MIESNCKCPCHGEIKQDFRSCRACLISKCSVYRLGVYILMRRLESLDLDQTNTFKLTK